MSRPARIANFLPSDAPSVPTTVLADRWRALFGSEPAASAALVEQAVAWQEQMLVYGDVAPTIARDLMLAARHARERRGVMAASPDPVIAVAAPDIPAYSVASTPDAVPCIGRAVSLIPSPPRAVAPRVRSRAVRAPLPPASSQLLPGTRLVKTHGGRTHVVEVVGDGFVYEGATFTSLSAVAKHITGTHWNGLLFFGLRRRKTYPAKVAARG